MAHNKKRQGQNTTPANHRNIVLWIPVKSDCCSAAMRPPPEAGRKFLASVLANWAKDAGLAALSKARGSCGDLQGRVLQSRACQSYFGVLSHLLYYAQACSSS